MNVVTLTIHRSAHTIGGNCIELSTSGGHRLLLDAGRPLDTPEGQPTPQPGSLAMDSSVDGILISHFHEDHVGMIRDLPGNWPVYCGSASADLLRMMGGFLDKTIPQSMTTWTSGESITVGPFHVTPRLTDHSAFDAYMLDIQVHGKRIFYTGDFRDHGRKASLVRHLCKHPPTDVDVLLIEGTNLGADKGTQTEETLEAQFLEVFKETPGRVFVSTSTTNIDRIVTLYRACKRAGRTLVMDLFAAKVLETLHRYGKIPQPDWPGINVVVTSNMARFLNKLEDKDRYIEGLKANGCAIGARKLNSKRHKWVVMARGSLVGSLSSSQVIPDASDTWIWSQWRGYLDKEEGRKQTAYFALCRKEFIHTSGHAAQSSLHTLTRSINSKYVVPVHGERWDDFQEQFANVMRLRDGESFSIL